MHLPSAISNALALANSFSLSGDKSPSCSVSLLSFKCMGPEMQHLGSVCEPDPGNGTYLSFPCNQKEIIWLQCYYGRTFHEIWNSTTNNYALSNTWTSQSPENQRLCACESEFFDTLTGCTACYQAHGTNAALFQDEDAIKSMSSSYCAATSMPTVGIPGMISGWYNRPQATSALGSAIAEAKTSIYSDPLSGSTAVSLYYTPTVTGSVVFNIAGVTHGATPTTTKVVHGRSRMVPAISVAEWRQRRRHAQQCWLL